MDDERIPGGTLLGFEDPGDGFRRESVGTQAVDGFGGKGDEAALAEQTGGAVAVGVEVGLEMERLGHRSYWMDQ